MKYHFELRIIRYSHTFSVGRPIMRVADNNPTRVITARPKMDDIPEESPVVVQCKADTMCVKFSKSYLAQHWSVDEWWGLHFSELCNEIQIAETLDHFQMCIGKGPKNFLSCGTKMSINETHAVFANNVTHFYPTDSLDGETQINVRGFEAEKVFG